ncbi:MAG: hypothetical protein IH845_00645 [Nanoarchaeota archaeon]|nr:hypothetical protein [Nanoarchaeota archaeon]
MIEIFKVIGIIGLMLIIYGIILRKRKNSDMFFIAGGVCLEIYSIYIGDMIFMILEGVFILASIYDLKTR